MKPIHIIGGGLAGLTLGIALRERGVPVTIIEAGRYPRHRVCGEFINGAGFVALEQLGLSDIVRALASRVARDASFFAGARGVGCHALPTPALCVSRFVLDAALSRRFCEVSGNLREGERWRGASFGEGIVCANGRRAHPVEDGWRWFGLKVHAHRVRLDADLEMHWAGNAYVGLCRLAQGEVNICGLFRRRANESSSGNSLDWLRGQSGSRLFARLELAEMDHESFCSIAGLSLRPEPVDVRECRIGDALTMIPPITGNGMSMAFESAHIALEPLLSYSRGKESWERTTARIAELLKQRFARRLQWARVLHGLLFSRFGFPALRLASCSAPVWRACFALTR